ncbi:MAG TPA: aspartate aminotransferase family protein [Oceanospirillaceae bacterium]|nr:aspartate aminotransferase family protein [Oceanospirillaceae bacterium]
MQYSELGYWLKKSAQWVDGYYQKLAHRPIRPSQSPGEFKALLPISPPQKPVPVSDIMADFERLVPNAMTHWQHPRFFAYFPANAAPASILAESLVNAMGAQAMLWQTSPAATEMEQVMVDWLRQALGLRQGFTGTIHDTATTATLCAILTMRERALQYKGLTEGMSGAPKLRIYASDQTHSSVDKGVRLAGIGQHNLVKIGVDASLSMDPATLRQQIENDLANGFLPAGVVLCVGGTSIGASDRVADIIAVAKEYDLYTHVDAAWAGSAMICPEFRQYWQGVDAADSIVFNPHKWLGAQFDCSVQFLADPTPQINTLGLRPSYLQTLDAEEVTNFNEWTVPLGRRFRALKLWFVMRAEGLDGLQAMIRNHVSWCHELANKFDQDDDYKLVTNCPFALFSFQYCPANEDSSAATKTLLNAINEDGRTYLTQTMVDGEFVIRVSVGPIACTRDDVMGVYDICKQLQH